MPRKAGIDAPGALHHIIVRGIERRRIFWDDADRDSFVERLGRMVSDTGTGCFAWALMPNHAHLFLRSDGTPIAGSYPNTVEARSVLCYWAVREFGNTGVELSKRLGVSQPTASQSVKRGEKIVKERGLKLTG